MFKKEGIIEFKNFIFMLLCLQKIAKHEHFSNRSEGVCG